MSDFVQIVTTTGSQEEAEKIAQHLVAHRLAACVQVGGPITSTYQWQGSLESGHEWQCAIKTRRSLYSAVERAIRQLHSYEVPEILALPIEAGNAAYLDWILAETMDPPDEP